MLRLRTVVCLTAPSMHSWRRLSPARNLARTAVEVVIGAYVLLGVLLGVAEKNEVSVALALPFVALASHVVYGIQFVRGLLRRQLNR